MNSPDLNTSAKIETIAEQLVLWISKFNSCAVAFSGGVDSSVVAKAAHLALGDQAIAITARSKSVSQFDQAEALKVANAIGIRHQWIETNEGEQEAYRLNDANRCYHCKTELYGTIHRSNLILASQVILNGANLDDQGDHRPGLRAATDFEVRSPLIECGINKQTVRLLAKFWNLPVWDRPASPCLASRIAYGEEVTPERLQMIERAEAFLRDLGYLEFRVRYHRGDLARIELPKNRLAHFIQATQQFDQVIEKFLELGFKNVTLDLQGFRSGNLNHLIQIDNQVIRS